MHKILWVIETKMDHSIQVRRLDPGLIHKKEELVLHSHLPYHNDSIIKTHDRRQTHE